MSNSTIIELRQLDSSDVQRNGFFSTTLDSPVLLEENDQVIIKAVYLDTSESAAGLIHLENDVDVNMEMAKYIQNYNLDQTFVSRVGATTNLREYPNPGVRTPTEGGDNAIWWLADASTNTSTTSWSVTKFNFNLVEGNNRDFGDCNISFKFDLTTPGGVKQFKTIKIKKHRRKKYDLINPVELNIICAGTADAPSLEMTSDPDYLAQHNIASIDFTPYQTKLPAGETIFNLQTETVQFTISAGDYSPAQMAALITDNLSNIEANGKVNALYDADSAATPNLKTNYPAESSFLTTILKNDKALQARAPVGETILQAFVNATNGYILPDKTDKSGSYYLNYNITEMKADYNATPFNPPLDKYVGANQVSMVFDENEQKLKWDSLHFPIYVNESDPTATPPSNDATPGVLYNNPENNAPTVWVYPTGMPIRYSGIAFTKLEPQIFWEKQLGFANTTISPQQNVKCRFPNNTSTLPAHNNSFTITALDGVNITGAFPGLDVGVIKSQTTYSTPPFTDLSTPDTAPTINISTPDTWGIFGDKSFNNSVADEGYFLVDVSPGIRQNLIGAGASSNSTQSIVNRYYTQNSFTSDQGAGSITYTHSGAPELLSNFQVRVLNPDKSPVDPTILQDKNSIFVEIVKTLPQNTIEPSQIEEKAVTRSEV